MFTEDMIKPLFIATALIYFFLRGKNEIEAINFKLIIAGLVLILVSGVLDWTDDIKSLNDVPIIGSRHKPWHDFVEDQVGDTLGLILLLWGVARETIGKGVR